MSMVKMLFVGNSGGCKKCLEKLLEDVENYLGYVGVKRWRQGFRETGVVCDCQRDQVLHGT
jgi:hypothetical protein